MMMKGESIKVEWENVSGDRLASIARVNHSEGHITGNVHVECLLHNVSISIALVFQWIFSPSAA